MSGCNRANRNPADAQVSRVNTIMGLDERQQFGQQRSIVAVIGGVFAIAFYLLAAL